MHGCSRAYLFGKLSTGYRESWVTLFASGQLIGAWRLIDPIVAIGIQFLAQLKSFRHPTSAERSRRGE